MQHFVARLFDCRHDSGMIVAESRTHLTGVEVQVLLAVHVGDDRVTCAGEHRPFIGFLVHPRAKAVARGVGEQLGFGRIRHDGSPDSVAIVVSVGMPPSSASTVRLMFTTDEASWAYALSPVGATSRQHAMGETRCTQLIS